MYNLYVMNIFLLIFLIFYIGAIPGVVIGYLSEKKGVPSKATVVFSRPDGSRVQGQMDVTWSWTILVFRGWALIFRGQFIEWLLVFFIGMFFVIQGAYRPDSTVFEHGYGALGVFNLWGAAVSNSAYLSVSDYFSNGANNVTIQIFIFISYMVYINYLVAYGNKRRILANMRRGMDFTLTPNYGALAEYLGVAPVTPAKDVAPNVRAGQAHNYVVPDAVVQKEVEDENDYSMLTVNDLKLLLRTEGISFDATSSKEELLKLVDLHLKEEKEPIKEEPKEEVGIAKKRDYTSITISELKSILNSEKIEFDASATKQELIELLRKFDSKEENKND